MKTKSDKRYMIEMQDGDVWKTMPTPANMTLKDARYTVAYERGRSNTADTMRICLVRVVEVNEGGELP